MLRRVKQRFERHEKVNFDTLGWNTVLTIYLQGAVKDLRRGGAREADHENVAADAVRVFIVSDLDPRELSQNLSLFVQARSWLQDIRAGRGGPLIEGRRFRTS